MRKKVEIISELLAEWISGWPDIQAVSLADTADADPDDPYFSLALDVYYSGDLLTPGERETWVTEQGGVAFESSSVNHKDRFLLKDLPVRIEYKPADRIEEVVSSASTPAWLFKEKGTYIFYRLERGHVIYDPEEWVARLQEQLKSFPDNFWITLRETSQTKMEHYLLDLGAAAFRNDRLYYYVSISGFLRAVCKTLFAINKVFEPSPRRFTECVTALERLPAGFEANFSSLIRSDEELDSERKWELANLLARSILAMT